MSKSKKEFVTNKEIIAEYFRLIQSKDIEGLKDLFLPNAIVLEPFSKLEEGLRGWSQIEPFMKVAIMANESLSYRIAFEEFDDQDMKNKYIKDMQINKENNNTNNNTDIVETLLTFEKGQTLKAKFRFELSNETDTINSSKKKIKSLYYIQFM
ncbi:MAG TPA: hypothetical protein VKA98_00100 [Nitrososphaeraceae archaeon]|nr:hypothetical protein [Nitrososphaeraceae archaeon]